MATAVISVEYIIARMSIDYLIGRYVGSGISIDSLMGKYLGFSIVRTSLAYLGFMMYVRFALTFHMPVAEERTYSFIRHRPPQA